MTDQHKSETAGEYLIDEMRRVKRAVITMTLFAAICVLVGLGALLGGKREVAALADSNADLTKRVNKLTAEVALKDARFLASKGVMEHAGKLGDLLDIQATIDNYAIVELHNGNSQGKTGDEVRREACAQLTASGRPCIP